MVGMAAALCLAAMAFADSLDRLPKVISQDEPEYPFSLRLHGNKGDVLISFYVDTDGSVFNPEVIKSSRPDFEAPAVESVLKWKFEPGIKNGQPVVTHMEVPIFFQLRYGVDSSGGADVWRIPDSAPRSLPAQYQYDEAPKPLVTSAPVYPFELLTQKVRGDAVVAFGIDPNGQTHVIKVVSATLPEFGDAAAAMIEAWTFEPARKDGKPSWALLKKEQVFSAYGDDFPVNDSAERLLKDLKRSPCPILRSPADLDVPLKGRFRPSPIVPASVLKAKVHAEAVIEFIVDHAGHAQLPRIVSSTNPDFGWAAATAVARWQFTVPSRKGKPADVFARVPMVYNPENTPPAGF